MDYMFTDTHVHFDEFEQDGSLGEILQAAAAAEIDRMIAVGGSPEANERTCRLAQQYPGIAATMGYDRDMAPTWRTLPDLAEPAQRTDIVAIGECGLDYHYEPETADQQKDLFRAMLDIASTARKPVIVHSRDADADTIALLREYISRQQYPCPGVLHCFTGSTGFAEALIELGFYISFSGIITFRNADPLRKTAREIPLDRILIETDAPYLAPVPHRGKRNEPAYVRQVAEQLAELHECSLSEMAAVTSANAAKLFNLEKLNNE